MIVVAQKNACGQEALRIATAADQAATLAQNQREGDALGLYNVLVGPTAWRFTSGLGLAYNDNIRATSTPESDFILSPSLDTAMHWPVTINNSLDLALHFGYEDYLQHSVLNQFFISSGSGFSFDVFVGDCKINLHDQIQITQNSYQNPGVNTGDNNTQYLQNTVGTSATFNLGKLVPTIGFDHANYMSLATSTTPDTVSENFTGSLGLPVREDVMVGVESGGSLINYTYSSGTPPSSSDVSGATQWSAGVFGNEQITDYIQVQLHGGYTEYIPNSTSTGNNSNNDSGLYASASLVHQLNQWLNYNITAGRSTDLSSFGQVQTRTYVEFSPTCTLFNQYTVSTPFTYQSGTQPGYTPGSGTPTYDQFQVGITVGRQITKKLSGTIGYQYIQQDSSQAGLAYSIDIISLNLSYQF